MLAREARFVVVSAVAVVAITLPVNPLTPMAAQSCAPIEPPEFPLSMSSVKEVRSVLAKVSTNVVLVVEGRLPAEQTIIMLFVTVVFGMVMLTESVSAWELVAMMVIGVVALKVPALNPTILPNQ